MSARLAKSSATLYAEGPRVRGAVITVRMITVALAAVIAISVIIEESVVADSAWEDVLKSTTAAQPNRQPGRICGICRPVLCIAVKSEEPANRIGSSEVNRPMEGS